MGLSYRRRFYSLTFVVVTATIYVTAVILFFVPAPGSDILVVDERLAGHRQGIRTRSREKDARTMRQYIRDFERDYVVVRPRKYTKERFYEGLVDVDPAALKKRFFNMYSFNVLESSKIGLERKIPDNRPQK